MIGFSPEDAERRTLAWRRRQHQSFDGVSLLSFFGEMAVVGHILNVQIWLVVRSGWLVSVTYKDGCPAPKARENLLAALPSRQHPS